MNVTSRLNIVAAGHDEPVRVAKGIETLIRTSCADSWISKSEVLRICAGLDTGVCAFADRSLDDQAFLRRGWKRRPTRGIVLPVAFEASGPARLHWAANCWGGDVRDGLSGARHARSSVPGVVREQPPPA